jgi:type II secretory pathway predicted ATPase ExeA
MIISPNLKSSNALLRLIMKEFNVKTDKKYENSLTLFGAFLQDNAVKGKVPVLFIDEAQLLKPDMLELVRFLLNFETNTQKLLQIVLFGQNELATNLESKKELKSRMYRSALASLNRSDMEHMIQFRFQVAGGAKHPFTPEGLDELYKFTLGLPREICKVTDMALLRAMVNNTHEVTAEIVRQTAEQLAINEQEDTAVTDKPPKAKAATESHHKAGAKTTL